MSAAFEDIAKIVLQVFEYQKHFQLWQCTTAIEKEMNYYIMIIEERHVPASRPFKASRDAEEGDFLLTYHLCRTAAEYQAPLGDQSRCDDKLSPGIIWVTALEPKEKISHAGRYVEHKEETRQAVAEYVFIGKVGPQMGEPQLPG